MAFFDEIGKKITMTGQSAVQKTKDVAGVMKLNSQITEEENVLNRTYTDIGKLYVQIHTDDYEEPFAALMDSVITSEMRIADLKNQVNNIKGVVKCMNCGAEVPINSPFCSTCGQQMEMNNNPGAYGVQRCSVCGVELQPGLNFCTNCGNMVDEMVSNMTTDVLSVPDMGNNQEAMPVMADSFSAEHDQKMCPVCGNLQKADLAFCVSCGSPMDDEQGDMQQNNMFGGNDDNSFSQGGNTKVCPECGNVQSGDFAFCTVCGAEMDQPANDTSAMAAQNNAANTSDSSSNARNDFGLRRCHVCGNLQDKSLMFCSSCGTQLDTLGNNNQTSVPAAVSEPAAPSLIKPATQPSAPSLTKPTTQSTPPSLIKPTTQSAPPSLIKPTTQPSAPSQAAAPVQPPVTPSVTTVQPPMPAPVTTVQPPMPAPVTTVQPPMPTPVTTVQPQAAPPVTTVQPPIVQSVTTVQPFPQNPVVSTVQVTPPAPVQMEIPPNTPMRKCPSCGNVQIMDYVFCTNCGNITDVVTNNSNQPSGSGNTASVQNNSASKKSAVKVRRCPDCGNVQEKDIVFCTKCGYVTELVNLDDVPAQDLPKPQGQLRDQAPPSPAPQPIQPPVQPPMPPKPVEKPAGGAAGTPYGDQGKKSGGPCLVRKLNNETYYITGATCKIGRDKGTNDYVVKNNKFIGHNHCHIMTHNGEYFIIDDNSKNHTYVNGVMLVPNAGFKLADGHIIKLANEEFEFKVVK